jgi:hypothetical protein
MGSREDVAARIEADTKIKIDEMQKAINTHKEAVSTTCILFCFYISLFFSLNILNQNIFQCIFR